MRITIRSVRGPVFSFCVDEAATVAQLKLLLEGIEGIAAAQQRLVFNGIQLADSLQLLHYGVGDGSILYFARILQRTLTLAITIYGTRTHLLLLVPDTFSIANLKRQIMFETGTAVVAQMLFCHGHRLPPDDNDARTLRDCGITMDTNVFVLLPRLPRGPDSSERESKGLIGRFPSLSRRPPRIVC